MEAVSGCDTRMDVSESLRNSERTAGEGGEECSLTKTYETGGWNASTNLLVSTVTMLVITLNFLSFFLFSLLIFSFLLLFDHTISFRYVGNEGSSRHLFRAGAVLQGSLESHALLGTTAGLTTDGPWISVRLQPPVSILSINFKSRFKYIL